MANQKTETSDGGKTGVVTGAPNGNGNGAKQDHPLVVLRNELMSATPQFQSALPSNIKVEQFKRVIMTAVNMNPDLYRADRRTFFNAAMKAAADGLLPDGREGALVIYKTKKKVERNGREVEEYIQAVQWLPMVYGLIKRLRQSAEISAISARVVYQNEVDQGRFNFKIVDGEEKLSHEPILIGERGKPVLVYASARFKDGTVQNEPLTLADVEKARAVSKTGNSEGGPWNKWWDEMARKTAIKRLAKYLPASAEDLRHVFARDDEDPTEFEQQKQHAIEAQGQSLVAAAALLGADSETGEIQDAEAVADA